MKRVVEDLLARIASEAAGGPLSACLAAAEALVERPHRARLLLRELLDGGRVLGILLSDDLAAAAEGVGRLTGEEGSDEATDRARTIALLSLLAHAVVGPIATLPVAPSPVRVNLRLRSNRAAVLDTVRHFLEGALAGPIRPPP